MTATTLGDGFHRVSGTNCAASTQVTAVVSGVGQTRTADDRTAPSRVAHSMSDGLGEFDATVFVGSEPGDYVVAVSCGEFAQSVAITVGDEQSAATGPPGDVDDTGLPLVRLGLVLALTGLLAFYADRRRRTSTSPS